MNFKSNTVKVGITVLGAIIVTFVGYRFMKDIPLFGQGNIISAVFERSEGLAPGRTVTLNGVAIGSIRHVALLPSDSVLIEMNINDGVAITQGSVAKIRSVDLLGTKAIEIVRGSSPQTVALNARIPGEIEAGGMEALAKTGEEIGANALVTTEHLNSILAGLDSTLNDQTRRDMQAIARNMESLTRTLDVFLKTEQTSMSAVLNNMANLTDSLNVMIAENRRGISGVVANLDSTTASMNVLTDEIAKTSASLTTLLNQINSGEGSLGRLAHDPSLYNNLDSLSHNLSILIRNLDENPRRYLRGMIRIF